MGFSLSASFAIIGVSFLICLEIFSGNVIPDITNIDHSREDMIQRKISQIQTDIVISNFTSTINGSSYDVTIRCENSGSTTIDMSKCILLINGTIYSFTYTDEYLFPKKETEISLTNFTETGNQRIKIVTENMIETYYEGSI